MLTSPSTGILLAGKNAAVKAAGSQRKLADLLGITRVAVCLWREIPMKRVLDVERVTGVDRSILRPDFFQRQEPT